MKKILFLTTMLLVSVLSLSAEVRTFYTLTPVYTFYEVNLDSKMFILDSESKSDANLIIKNYKKSGNKETFNTYMREGETDYKVYKVELNTNAQGQKVIILNGQITPVGTKDEQKTVMKKDKQASAGTKAGVPSKSDSQESDVKKTINKGLNVFKKKK